MKISIIGAGSTYTPELIEGIAGGLLGTQIDELVFMDTDPERLRILGGLAQRMLARGGWNGRLQLTTSQEAALDGVDACLLQYRIGGAAARIRDEVLALEHGVIGQETVGPGGWASAMRTVPRTLEIAEELARRSPRAWLLDFANPVSIVTQALVDEGHRAIGLCNVAIALQRSVATRLAIAPERVEVESAGLNHASWYRDIRVDGASHMSELIDSAADTLAAAGKVSESRIRSERAVPSYYLRYYDDTASVLAEQQREGTRGTDVLRIERELLSLYDEPNLDTKPALLEQRGGAHYSSAALDLIGALCGDRPRRMVVNAMSGGAIPDLPPTLVIEALCEVDQLGARPVQIPPLGSPRVRLIDELSEFTMATARAAAARDTKSAIKALALNPLVPNRTLAESLGTALLAD
jgi:6-phospho-beta-glucosidase